MDNILTPIWEHNGYHDSDFFAYVWNGSEVVAQCVGTTRAYAPCPSDNAWKSTPADIMELAAADAAAVLRKRILDQHNAELHAVRIGSRVVLPKGIRGKGKNACAPGTTGTVRWIEENRSAYGTWSYGYTVGVDLDGETEVYRGREKARRIFVKAERVTVIPERPDYVLDEIPERRVDPTGPAIYAALRANSAPLA